MRNRRTLCSRDKCLTSLDGKAGAHVPSAIDTRLSVRQGKGEE